jgi:hypothetical protein
MSDTWQPPPLPPFDYIDDYERIGFTAEQMHAYGAASFRAGMERAAEIAIKVDLSEYPSDIDDAVLAIRKEAGNG